MFDRRPVVRRILAAGSALALVLAACTDGVAEPGTTRPVPVGSPDPSFSPPSTRPQAVPVVVTAPARGRLVIHGVGDVALDPAYIPALAAEGYEHAWAGLGDLFTDDDLTVINLECAASDLGIAADKAFTFRCDPDALPAAATAGVDVANLANNHGRDFGTEALLDSVDQLRAAGIAPVGVGPNADAAGAPAVFEVEGWTVAVVGFGGVVPSRSWLATDTQPGMRDGDDIETMVQAVEAADAVADLVIVTIHWGVELDTEPRADDVARAEALVAAGADAIFGHHSHRLNPLGFVGGRPVAWGLGNFVWPRFSVAGSTTAVARVVVEPDGRVGGCLLPAEIVSSGHPRLVDDIATCTVLFDGVPAASVDPQSAS